MVFTTKAKIFLKKYSPAWLFSIIRWVADWTILPLLPLLFRYRSSSFKHRTVKKVHYAGREFSIVIDPKNGYLDAQVYTLPLYEPHIVKEFVDNISEGDVCIDVGANIGHHTIIMSQSAGKNGKVIAFEPIPYIKRQMEESLQLNHITNVEIIPDGLSNKEEDLTLHINDGNVAGSSLVNEGKSESINIHLNTLDSYQYPRVNFMKIDVEGFEYNVLAGGLETITRERPRILFEFSPTYYRKYDPTHIEKILAFFTTLNYTLIDLENNRSVITDTNEFIKEFAIGLRSQTNILALPK